MTKKKLFDITSIFCQADYCYHWFTNRHIKTIKLMLGLCQVSMHKIFCHKITVLDVKKSPLTSEKFLRGLRITFHHDMVKVITVQQLAFFPFGHDQDNFFQVRKFHYWPEKFTNDQENLFLVSRVTGNNFS